MRLIVGHSAWIFAKPVGQKPTPCGKIQVARKARREFSRLFSPFLPSPPPPPIPVLARQDGKFFFSRSSRRDRDRDQLRGSGRRRTDPVFEYGTLSEDYMHFNYRTDAAALTLPRRLVVVKFPNYRYWGQGCGALNPKGGLHFELLVTFDMARFPLEIRQTIREHLY